MIETTGFESKFRTVLIVGLVVFVALSVALFAWDGEEAAVAADRATAQLVDLPENDAPLADVAETLTPEPADDPAPRAADVTTLASLPSIPSLTAAMADAVEPLMFMENLDSPEAQENPAVSYATAGDFMMPGEDAPPLRAIDGRPVQVLAAIGGSGRGMGIGGDGPHCKPQRGPGLRFRRSAVVSGVAARLAPRM